MNTTKLIGLLQGMAYAVGGVIVAYLAHNVGASGVFSGTTGVIISGLLSVLDDYILKQNGGNAALFGMINTPTTYTHD